MNQALRIRMLASVLADLRILARDLALEGNSAAVSFARESIESLGGLYTAITMVDDDEPSEDTNPQTPSAISSAPPPRMGPGESGRIEVGS